MATELVSMSRKEIDRLEVIRRVIERRLTQVKAAQLLELGPRQVGRLCACYERRGPSGLVSRQRGKASNRRLPEAVQVRAVELVRERYADFGPTLAGEEDRKKKRGFV
jgi:Helix-turn-helix domain